MRPIYAYIGTQLRRTELVSSAAAALVPPLSIEHRTLLSVCYTIANASLTEWFSDAI